MYIKVVYLIMKKIIKAILKIPINLLGQLYRDYLVFTNNSEYLIWSEYNGKMYYTTNNKKTFMLGDYVFVGKDIDPLYVK